MPFVPDVPDKVKEDEDFKSSFVPESEFTSHFVPDDNWIVQQSKLANKRVSDLTSEFLKAIPRGFLSVGKGVVGTVEWAIPGEQQSLLKMADKIESAKQRETIKYEPETLAGKAGALIGEAVPYLAASYTGAGIAGAAGRAAGLGGKGIKIAEALGAATAGFTVEGQNAYDDAIATGATEDQANKERVIVGTINAALEGWATPKFIQFKKTGDHSVKALVNSIKKKAWKVAGNDFKKLTAQGLKVAFNESVEEFLQEGVSMGVPAAMRNEYPKTPEGKPDWSEIGLQLGTSAVGGFVAGGVLGGGIKSGQTIEGLATPSKDTLIGLSQKIKSAPSTAYSKALQNEVLNKIAVKEGIDFYVKPPAEATIVLDAANRVAENMAQFETRRPLSRKHIKESRGRKFQAMEDIYTEPTLDAEARTAIAQAEAKGFDREVFPDMADTVSREDLELIKDNYHFAKDINPTDKLKLDNMFNSISEGVLPHPSEIKLFDSTFGTSLYNTYKNNLSTSSKVWNRVLDGLNFRKAIMASGDVSFGGRQGWLYMMSHPVKWSKDVGRGYRAFASEGYQQVQEIEIKTHPYYMLANNSGLEFTEAGGGPKASEYFRSNLAERIPGIGKVVKASERAFNTTGNSMRFHKFYDIAEQWEGTGRTSADYKTLADWINASTGRGRMPKSLAKYEATLNAAFWAPKLTIGRVQAVTDLVTATSATRKIIAGDLVRASLSLAGVIGVLSAIPGMELEKDPNSSDWGKGKMGNTRFDLLGGYQQIVRLVYQMGTSQRKSTATGMVSDVERRDILWRFLRGKLSPEASLAVDISTGETFRGEKTKWADPEFTFKYLYEGGTFLFAQDIIDAIAYQGIGMAAVVAPLAANGIGASTYEITPSGEASNIKNKLARQFFGVKWDELGPEGQKAIRGYTPLIDVYENRASLERENFNFAGKLIEEQQLMGKRVQKSLSRPIRNELDRLELEVGGFSRRIKSNWFLNKERHKAYADLSQGMIEKALGRLLANPNYNRMGDSMQKDLVNAVIKDIKQIAREKLVAEATIKDVENRQSEMLKGK